MPSELKKWICRRKLLWIALLAFTLVHLLLGLMASTAIERGSPSYYILMVDFGLIAVLLVVIGLVFWQCGYLDDEAPMH